MDKSLKQYFEYINEGGNLKNIPEEYITKDLCDNYIHSRGIASISQIPKKYQTNEMYNLQKETLKELN